MVQGRRGPARKIEQASERGWEECREKEERKRIELETDTHNHTLAHGHTHACKYELTRARYSNCSPCSLAWVMAALIISTVPSSFADMHSLRTAQVFCMKKRRCKRDALCACVRTRA